MTMLSPECSVKGFSLKQKSHWPPLQTTCEKCCASSSLHRRSSVFSIRMSFMLRFEVVSAVKLSIFFQTTSKLAAKSEKLFLMALRPPFSAGVPKKIHRVGTVVPTQWYKSFTALKLQYHRSGTAPALRAHRQPSVPSSVARRRNISPCIVFFRIKSVSLHRQNCYPS